MGLLSAKGSLFVTRPTLMTYTRNRELLLACAGDLIEVVASGAVKIEIHQRFPLAAGEPTPSRARGPRHDRLDAADPLTYSAGAG